jgi:uncharacterized protein YdeI (BOF family)
MRNLIIVLLMMISFASVEAQITFEGKKLTTQKNGKFTTEDLESKIVINADTTEIDIKLKGARINEKIGELYSTFEEDTYKIFVYKQENGDTLILHINNNVLFSVMFQTGIKDSIEFE